ncbi:hypothetical protein TH53_18660 [Pedobacter lusitanus]|uniref:Uncharacterized protein n=2 Tax=Pedobacter lusitanus TaxID=1503925 RepID=A0A0D0GMW1_9SPHI|nr:hypothetical protein [Pedobacter lusitanus]KIO75776.1 hypothetical protein TH53_18660 [Pedobacter lusitanus]
MLLTVLFVITVLATNAQVGFRLKPRTSTIEEGITPLITIKDNTTGIKDGMPPLTTIGKDKSKVVYKTLDIVDYNYKTTIKKDKDVVLQKLIQDLYDNSIKKDGKAPFSQTVLQTKSDSVKRLQKEIAGLQTTMDSLYYIYVKDLMTYRSINMGFGSLRSRAFFDLIYGNQGKRFNALGNAGVNFGNNTGSVYSELVNGNLGLFRVSLGTMVSSNSTTDKDEAKKEEAYQRLITYGGNTVLNFEYPLAYLHSKNNQYNLVSRLITKGTADFPAFGTITEKWAGSGSLGIDIYADAATSNNSLRFFCNFNASKLYGTDVFRDNLGINKSNFTFGQVSLGLVFLERFKISFIIATMSSEKSLQNRHVIAGGQVLN